MNPIYLYYHTLTFSINKNKSQVGLYVLGNWLLMGDSPISPPLFPHMRTNLYGAAYGL